jgi:DEAD/DEAH box helicase domain-containing protein
VHPAGAGEHVLDVETLWLSHELPDGWARRGAMRVSCCVLHDLGTRRWVAFTERPVPGTGARPLEHLFRFLEACRSEGCTLVGHNLRAFDWEVLAGEFEARGWLADARAWGPGRARLVDTMSMLEAKLGWRPSLQKLALHNLGESKSMDGAQAPSLWRAGRRAEVVRYCRRDVELTARLWAKGRAEGRLAYLREDGTTAFVDVPW